MIPGVEEDNVQITYRPSSKDTYAIHLFLFRFLSPPVLIHGGLIYMSLSICPSVKNNYQKFMIPENEWVIITVTR